MESMKIKEFLKTDFGFGNGDGSGYGYGDGYGYGSGDGDGYGDGSGYGSGDGYGYGDGSGDGSGYGSGYGYGDGYGYGSGFGYGDGSGDGHGDGSIKSLNRQSIYYIDGVPTIISRIKNNLAKGCIVNADLTTTPCFIIKGNNLFAHGETLKQAIDSLQGKLFDGMSEDERIEAFLDKFCTDKKYSNAEFFDWHGRLTGSCQFGREQFAKDHDIDLIGGEMTVVEFLTLTKDAYGGNIIREIIDLLPEKSEV